MLFVLRVRPSGLAPYFLMLILSFLKLVWAITGSLGPSAKENLKQKRPVRARTIFIFIMIHV
jgi:hypothetical protein